MDLIGIVIFIFILLFSVIFHEVAHGLMAEKLGDPTARFAGRLTLNPIPHIDIYGSILLPALMYFATNGTFVFGSAKPVPVNYSNLRNFKRDMILVAIVGPLTNFALAIVAALTLRYVPGISTFAQSLLFKTISLNLVLGLFNLIPIPPLDGSKILGSILGFIDRNLMYRFMDLERFGFLIVILLLFTGIFEKILYPPLRFLMVFLIGS